MIVDALQLDEGTEIKADVAIIGGGPAGITAALELAERFGNVVLLESGGYEFEQPTQDLYDGPLLGHKDTDIAISRLRYLGGASNHWMGYCAPLDAVDFQEIAGRPYSGWPFDLGELIPYYRRAYPYCDLGVFRQNIVLSDRGRATARRIADTAELEPAQFRMSLPTRFGTKYQADLRSSARINVFLHANLTNIRVAAGGTSASSLAMQTLAGKRFSVQARSYVLCCGGVENARILLNCRDTFPNGIGNDHDLVGRFFMDHLELLDGATIFPVDQNFELSELLYGWDDSVRLVGTLKNTDAAIKQSGSGGCSIVMRPRHDIPVWAERAAESPAYNAFRGLLRDVRRGGAPADLGRNACEALSDPSAVALGLYDRIKQSISGGHPLKSITVNLYGEQFPDPNSRVMLINDVDALGMRKVGLDWRISTDDFQTLYKTAMIVARAVGASGFGRMVLDFGPDYNLSKVSSAWHHMGTTRMSNDSRKGVVDMNCKVHGLSNLFIAGSSVFPTGGRVNPTVTIVALAIRLADHLKQTVTRQ